MPTYDETDLPPEDKVKEGYSYAAGTKTGTYRIPSSADVRNGVGYGSPAPGFTPPFDFVGEWIPDYAPEGRVQKDWPYGDGTKTGTLQLPGAGDVKSGVGYGAPYPAGSPPYEFVGEFVPSYPVVGDVREGVDYADGSLTGELHLPDVAQVLSGVVYGADNPSSAGTFTGTLSPGPSGTIPSAGDVRYGTAVGSTTGTLRVPSPTNVLTGIQTDATTGSLTIPSAADVRASTSYGVSGTGSTGTLAVPSATNVLSGVSVGATTGSLVLPTADKVLTGTVYGVGGTGSTGTLSPGSSGTIPAASDVRNGIAVGSTSGTLVVPTAENVLTGVAVDGSTGTLALPTASNVRVGVQFGKTSALITGNVVVPIAANVKAGISVDTSGTGTLSSPAVGDVRKFIQYGSGGTERTGTLLVPSAGDVRNGISYGAGGTEFTGSLSTDSEESADGMPLEGLALTAETSVYFTEQFAIASLDLTGWQSVVFVIKRKPLEDDDSEALLIVRKSSGSPGDAPDGAIRKFARPLAGSTRAMAAITVDTVSPDAKITVELFPSAMELPTSPDSLPYGFELNYWDADGIKQRFAKGSLVVYRGVLRAVAAP